MKSNVRSYTDQEILDRVKTHAEGFIDYPKDYDYLDYVGRKIRTNNKIFVGNNPEHAILECLFDAINNGKDLKVNAFKQQPNCKNIKLISIYNENEEVEFQLCFNAMCQDEDFDY